MEERVDTVESPVNSLLSVQQEMFLPEYQWSSESGRRSELRYQMATSSSG